MADVDENLFGCYLLYCLNEKYKGHTYIGYTVNPLRRIRQHNNGVKAGGAKRTSNKGPWEMVLIIHGFPNSIAALKFEWAWQHPNYSRRLRHIHSKKATQTTFQYKVYVVSEMLRVGPWKRLPLTIRWLKQEYVIDFDSALRPPSHMPIVYGLVTCQKADSKRKSPVKRENQGDACTTQELCTLCIGEIKDPQNRLRCINPKCGMLSHMLCLADRFSDGVSIIPIEGSCPLCECSLLWGDLIKHKKGCFRNLILMEEDDDFSQHWATALNK